LHAIPPGGYTAQQTKQQQQQQILIQLQKIKTASPFFIIIATQRQ
jgi:hypothetical protein